MTRADFNKDLASCLSALDGVSGVVASDGGSSQDHPTLTESVADIDQEWSADSGQVAIAVEQPMPDGAVSGQERKRILICGHSMVFWAANQAKRTQFGSQLGLCAVATVDWQGRHGLRWPGLLPLLFRGRKGPPPHIVVIHLGGNDLGLVQGKALSMQVAEDLEYISSRWPSVLIVWSEMLQRRVWWEAFDTRIARNPIHLGPEQPQNLDTHAMGAKGNKDTSATEKSEKNLEDPTNEHEPSVRVG
ncbi:uncharacterized protein LOC129323422 [Eublepharis macularius]|uniref:Uncharacterized protein LOC129323422 n=1 Tax=Eublepharis macularius TaxID=481883 RepID=A0AA97IUP2_EUBMA|nr:uncharacterized protein LOC129323422 [Eublepharis macularius]